jgi:DNA-3-methyladenine glycosylase I
MEKPKSYCEAVWQMADDSVHRDYHDTEYGFPIYDDDMLFARLVLEINQAGLSWTTILNKKDGFFRAYDGFRLQKVAHYGVSEIERLLSDPGIIRNRLKINAAIHNAQVITGLQQSHGTFKAWLDAHHPKTLPEWVKLFKQTFKFTGGEIVGSFLMSVGYLPGAHIDSCPIYRRILEFEPPFLGIDN